MAAENHMFLLLEKDKENMVELRPCACDFTRWCEMSQAKGCVCVCVCVSVTVLG